MRATNLMNPSTSFRVQESGDEDTVGVQVHIPGQYFMLATMSFQIDLLYAYCT